MPNRGPKRPSPQGYCRRDASSRGPGWQLDPHRQRCGQRNGRRTGESPGTESGLQAIRAIALSAGNRRRGQMSQIPGAIVAIFRVNQPGGCNHELHQDIGNAGRRLCRRQRLSEIPAGRRHGRAAGQSETGGCGGGRGRYHRRHGGKNGNTRCHRKRPHHDGSGRWHGCQRR